MVIDQDLFIQNPSTSDTESMTLNLRTKVGADERRDEEDFPTKEMNVERDTPLIRMAMPSDAKDIEKLAASLALPSMDKKTALAKGFLVSGYGRKEYAKFVKTAEHFLTLHVGKELVGFLLAYGSEQITDPEKEELNMHIKNELSKGTRFVLIKQIGVSEKHRRKNYAKLLYKELFARSIHYYEHEQGGNGYRPFYLAIVKEPANPVSEKFHENLGFKKEPEEYTPKIDNKPRLIYRHTKPHMLLDKDESESCPFYNSAAAMDPHCIGVGLSIYSIAPPDGRGLFEACVRVVMKWRQPGIEKRYKRIDDGQARTTIKMKDHEDERTILRLPRCDINQESVETEQDYAYIDKTDPIDVITWQRVFRGQFIGVMNNLTMFPVDVQELRFAFRIWDNDPDDRCRYFRQLYYADNTPWQLGVKRKITSVSFGFLAPQSAIEIFPISQTSRYILKVNALRESWYYLRTVGFPIVLITSLSFATPGITEFGDRISFNSSILLTAVAYLFITKDVTPPAAEVTILDIVTYGALCLCWLLIIIEFLFDVSRAVQFIICASVVGLQVVLCVIAILRYTYILNNNDSLGTY